MTESKAVNQISLFRNGQSQESPPCLDSLPQSGKTIPRARAELDSREAVRCESNEEMLSSPWFPLNLSISSLNFRSGRTALHANALCAQRAFACSQLISTCVKYYNTPVCIVRSSSQHSRRSRGLATFRLQVKSLPLELWSTMNCDLSILVSSINEHYRSKVWGHPDNFMFSMKTNIIAQGFSNHQTIKH